MIIHKIIISNFRGINHFESIIKGGLLSIVGQNDSGKSSILRAIRMFFGYEKITTDDFPRNKEDSSIEIELHFLAHGFNDLKYDGKLMLKQIYNLGKNNKITDDRLVYTKNKLPTEEELENYSDYKNVGKLLGIEFPPRKPNAEKEKKLKEEVLNAIKTSPNYTWQDAGEYWTTIKEKFPEIIFIPAAQDHDNEQKMTNDSSVFGQLFRVGIKNWLKKDEDSKKALDVIESKVSEINNEILKIVETKLKEQLSIAENLSQKVAPLDISKGFSFTMQVKDAQGIDTPLHQRGSGLQRAVLIAAIRAQNEVQKLINNLSRNDDNFVPKQSLNRILYILEEPEAFLHLAAQKELFYSLKDLTEHQSQVILTTHSTLFMDENDIQDVVLLNRVQGKTTSVQHIPTEDIRDTLGEQIKISKLITGKVCCIVEGISDKLALERWAKTLGHDTKRLGVHFISMDGCKNVDYYANVDIIKDFGVPFRIILDDDHHGESKNRERKEALEKKFSWLRRGYIKLINGELENYYCLDAVSEVLKIPKEFIDEEYYRKAPKKALEEATKNAIDAGHKGARKYKESSHSKIIAEKMIKEEIHEDIVNVIEDLISLVE